MDELVEYTGVNPNDAGQTVEEKMSSCASYRLYILDVLVPWLMGSTATFNSAVAFVNQLFDSALYRGEYDPLITYAQKESVSIGDDIYISKIDENVATPPSASWLMIPRSVRVDDTNQDIDGVKNFLNMPTVAGYAVVDSGANAIGDWTKFSDGTLLQSVNTYVSATVGTNVPIVAGTSALLPIPFYDTSYGCACSCVQYGNAYGVVSRVSDKNHTYFRVDVHIIGGDYVTAGSLSLTYLAIGRWKA